MAIKLVDGDLILHILDDNDAYHSYCSSLGLKRSNMDELVGSGREGVDGGFKYNHTLLASLRWMKSDSGIIMPVLSYDHAVTYLENLKMTLDHTKLKYLMLKRTQKLKEVDASGKVVRIWKKIDAPSIIYGLLDGSSLYGLEKSAAAQPVLPDLSIGVGVTNDLNLSRSNRSIASLSLTQGVSRTPLLLCA